MSRFTEIQKEYDNKEHPDYSAENLFNSRLDEKVDGLTNEIIDFVREGLDDVGLNADDMSVPVYDNLVGAIRAGAENLITLKMEKE